VNGGSYRTCAAHGSIPCGFANKIKYLTENCQTLFAFSGKYSGSRVTKNPLAAAAQTYAYYSQRLTMRSRSEMVAYPGHTS